MSIDSFSPAEAIDPGVRPQDDLFRHVNGRWIDGHEIPADRGSNGAFYELRDLSEERVRDIVTSSAEHAESPEARKIGDLYSSFMNTERIESLGTAALRPDLELITAALDRLALARALGRLQATGADSAIGLFVEPDAHDPERYAPMLWQGGLGLPDEEYYRSETHAETRTAYVAHVAEILALSGVVSADEAQASADRVVTFETALADAHWDKVRSREADQIHNAYTWDQLVGEAPGFEWEVWREALEIPDGALDDLVVCQPSFFTGFAALWAETDVETLRLWLLWHTLHSRASYLTAAFVEANFEFYGRTLTGAEEIRDRWKRGVTLVEGALGEAVGKVYVEHHFPPGHKAAITELVDNLIEAYRESIESLDWMGEETRRRALEKLTAFRPKVGYPDEWRDYSSLSIDDADLLGNVRAANGFEFRRELNKLGKPVDKNEWLMPPQMVNAYYHPMLNEIVFPAAILQPPFFDPETDDAWNYGGIGAVIGHEIGHGFDDQGSKYDGSGRLQDWWTEKDREEFSRRTSALIAQFDAYSPAQLDDSHRVNGSLTIGENIGDLGGLSIAIKAYDIALRKQGLDGLDEAPVIDGLTGLQRVFYSWGRVWRAKARDAYLVQQISVDPHSPAEFRCNGTVRNVDHFAQAFDVQPGDPLYLPPEERVRIW